MKHWFQLEILPVLLKMLKVWQSIPEKYSRNQLLYTKLSNYGSTRYFLMCFLKD